VDPTRADSATSGRVYSQSPDIFAEVSAVETSASQLPPTVFTTVSAYQRCIPESILLQTQSRPYDAAILCLVTCHEAPDDNAPRPQLPTRDRMAGLTNHRPGGDPPPGEESTRLGRKKESGYMARWNKSGYDNGRCCYAAQAILGALVVRKLYGSTQRKAC